MDPSLTHFWNALVVIPWVIPFWWSYHIHLKENYISYWIFRCCLCGLLSHCFGLTISSWRRCFLLLLALSWHIAGGRIELLLRIGCRRGGFRWGMMHSRVTMGVRSGKGLFWGWTDLAEQSRLSLWWMCRSLVGFDSGEESAESMWLGMHSLLRGIESDYSGELEDSCWFQGHWFESQL